MPSEFFSPIHLAGLPDLINPACRASLRINREGSDGDVKLSDGARKVSGGVRKVSDGVREVLDEVRKVSDGFRKVS
jgi:hypothetical protein